MKHITIQNKAWKEKRVHVWTRFYASLACSLFSRVWFRHSFDSMGLDWSQCIRMLLDFLPLEWMLSFENELLLIISLFSWSFYSQNIEAVLIIGAVCSWSHTGFKYNSVITYGRVFSLQNFPALTIEMTYHPGVREPLLKLPFFCNWLCLVKTGYCCIR